MISCQDKKSKPENNELKAAESEILQAQIELGEKLFSENICNTCHFNNHSDIGPSIKNIVEMYKEQDKSIVAYLQGKSEPIVDTDDSQVAIMHLNIDAFINVLSLEELEAMDAYMKHTAEN